MVDVTESTADELQSLADNNGDLTLEDVQETFKEKYEEIDSKSDWDSERVEKFALRRTRTNVLKSNRVPADEVELLTIGGDVRNWSNGDTFVGKALVDENPEEDGGKNRLATIIIDGGDVEPPEAYSAFDEVGNIVRGQFSVSEADIKGFRVLNSTEDTSLDVTRPDNRQPLYDEIRNSVPEVSIDNIAENLSATSRNDDGNVYPASFGVDIRRIEGDIYDGYKNPEAGNGTYTIRDDTVFDEQDIVESPVHNPDNANENATPGLTCWTDPGKMDYGSESVCEFFGTISQNEDGEVVMNVDGIIPILTEEWDGYTDNSSGEATSDAEVDTSNVDRTQI